MSERQRTGYGIITLTFLVAFVLLVVPLPAWLQWGRPEWVTLTLIYWCIALPQRVGITIGLLAGLGVDVLEGSLLGQHGLALVVVAFLALILYQRLRVYSLLQQAAVGFVLVGISQLLCQWVQNVDGASGLPKLFLLPALTSALVWPFVLHTLRGVRRRFEMG